MPGSPRMTSDRLAPSRTSPSNRSSVAHSRSLPTSAAAATISGSLSVTPGRRSPASPSDSVHELLADAHREAGRDGEPDARRGAAAGAVHGGQRRDADDLAADADQGAAAVARVDRG